jgi:hypothetical protein
MVVENEVLYNQTVNLIMPITWTSKIKLMHKSKDIEARNSFYKA